MSRIFAICAALWLALANGGAAQELSALARVNPAGSSLADAGRGIELVLDLSQPVPYAVRLLDQPPRLVIDFREVDWSGLDLATLNRAGRVIAVQTGPVRPGWSRLVAELTGPFGLSSAALIRDDASGRGRLDLRLDPVAPEAFATQAGPAQSALWGLPAPEVLPPPRARQDGSRPVRVVLDPGHGGIDPGAERDGVVEADLMLTFAREIQDAMSRAGFDVVLTRTDNSFVPLEARLSVARAAGADVFLSLHADIVTEGRASGATVYTLSDSASDRASEVLAERHDRADLLAGVDLAETDDVIAGVLMDLARTETAPRSERLADALVAGLKSSVGRMHKRPHLSAGFSVLKAPDIPSALIEIGFLSSPKDLKNLTDPEWRGKAAEGIRNAVQKWAQDDAAQGALLRQ